MSRDLYELLKKFEYDSVETQLALQCSPLLIGLKISNLLIIESSKVALVKQLLSDSNIYYFTLISKNNKTTLLLYRKNMLINYVCQDFIIDFFNQMGYELETNSINIKQLLTRIKTRYQMYTDGKCGFPHEMGLILGYPIEDVIGFIENEGKNYLCNGYWKVYHNAPAKQRVFDNYKKATETITKLVSSGVSVRKCIDISFLYTVN